MNKHTPGPWKTWGNNGCLVVDSNGLQVADMFHGIPVLHRSDAECRENARLIAAAPDLLAALQEVIAAADGNGWDQLSPSLKNQRMAVAKAGGES